MGGIRFLAAAACASILFGCGGSSSGGDGGDSGAPPVTPPGPFNSETLPTLSSFFDDFSGQFPGASWRVKTGAPNVDADRGNPFEGLAMSGGRVQSGFIFSTGAPFSISVEVGTPELAAGQTGRFRFELERAFGETAAEFEIKLDEGVIRFDETEVPFPGDTDFHTFQFRVEMGGAASWLMDGVVVATSSLFPAELARLDVESEQGSAALFIVDNLLLSVPQNGGGAVSELTDDLSNGFSGGLWEVLEGEPFPDKDLGNPAPALMLGPATNHIRIASLFTFTTADPLNLSFDFATFDLTHAPEGWLKFDLKRDAQAEPEASFEVSIGAGEMRLKILGAETVFTFTPDASFHTIAFAIDANGVATWWIDGVQSMSRAGFPQGLFRIQVESDHRGDTGFVLDNVVLDRP